MYTSIPDAEVGILSALMLYPTEAIALCNEKEVTGDSFGESINRIIYNTVKSMIEKGYGIDHMTVSHELEKKNLSHVMDAFFSITEVDPPVPFVLPSYIAIIKKEELRRNINRSARELISKSNETDEPSELLVEMQEKLIDLSPKTKNRTKEAIKAAAIDDWITAKKYGFRGIVTPWPSVNERLGGLGDGLVSALAGQRGTGKSSLLNTWGHFLGKSGVKFGWLPLEDGAENTMKRLAGIEGDFSVFLMNKGESTDVHISRASAALDAVTKYPIFMGDEYMSMSQIRSWATNLKAKEDIKLLMIDGFKDIIREGNFRSSIEADEHLSRSLCALARSLRIPILVIHHIVKGTDGNRMTLDDIRGSGRIIDDARTVLILQKDGNEYSLDIAKNNHGPANDQIKLRRISNRCMFTEEGTIFEKAKNGVFKI